MVSSVTKPKSTWQQAKEVQAKLDRVCASRSEAARLTAFWLYLTTLGPTAAVARMGKTYYKHNAKLMKALSS